MQDAKFPEEMEKELLRLTSVQGIFWSPLNSELVNSTDKRFLKSWGLSSDIRNRTAAAYVAERK